LIKMFDSKYGLTYHINKILKGNDLQMIDQCIWLCANTCGESIKLRNMIVSVTNIIDCISRLIHEATNIS
jgi:hypothetical protein